MKAKIISIFTQKGGVSKTTSTINIGGALAEQGFKVLLIDLDTQRHLSLGLGIENFDFNINDFLISNDVPAFVEKGNRNNLFVLPGNKEMTETNFKRDSLKKAISKIENDFDYILIDCPPKPISEVLSFGEMAVFASDYVLSPIYYDEYSLDGVTTLILSLNRLREQKGLKAKLLGFFFSIVEENTVDFISTYQDLTNSAASKFLFKNYVRKDALIRTTIRQGETAIDLKPFSRVSMDYKRLTDEIIYKIKDNA